MFIVMSLDALSTSALVTAAGYPKQGEKRKKKLVEGAKIW